MPITSETLRQFTAVLQRYKTGKASLERRVVAAENWWKLRNRFQEGKEGHGSAVGYQSESGWLHNVIVSKHADAMEAYPEPLLLPREPGDEGLARLLSAVLPCILEQNRFERTYDAAMWQKLKTGTAAYRVSWNAEKLGGLGDIEIERVDLLNLFWEPGVADIQRSRYFFCTHLEDEQTLAEEYPQLRGRLRADPFRATRFVYDDAVSLEDKATVVEVYYKKKRGGKTVLHYCKYVGDTVLFATENEDEDKGLYAHGRYPFVFDALFPVEGSPCGYGFVDLCANVQTAIDLMRTAFVKNTVVGATPRYFQRIDGSVNEEEFADISRPLVHVSGNLGEDSLRQIGFDGLPGVYVSVLESTIRELRETTGNTETANGTMNVGVTAASAIQALQEASSKGSRDASRASYDAFREIVELCIELIREFYTLPRQFRIAGAEGERFVSLTNEALLPRERELGGAPLGLTQPVFDVKVSAQKRSAYSRLSQNELAMELYRMGVLEPGKEQQALGLLELMDFEGRDALRQRLQAGLRLGEKLRELQLYKALALGLTKRYRPEMLSGGAGAPPEAHPANGGAPVGEGLAPPADPRSGSSAPVGAGVPDGPMPEAAP